MADAAVLTSKYQLHNLNAYRAWVLSSHYDLDALDWRRVTRENYAYILGSPHGRDWYEAMRPLFRSADGVSDFDLFKDELANEASSQDGCSADMLAIAGRGAGGARSTERVNN